MEWSVVIKIPLDWIKKVFSFVLKLFKRKIVPLDEPEFKRCPACGHKTLQIRPIKKIAINNIDYFDGDEIEICLNESCPKSEQLKIIYGDDHKRFIQHLLSSKNDSSS